MNPTHEYPAWMYAPDGRSQIIPDEAFAAHFISEGWRFSRETEESKPEPEPEAKRRGRPRRGE